MERHQIERLLLLFLLTSLIFISIENFTLDGPSESQTYGIMSTISVPRPSKAPSVPFRTRYSDRCEPSPWLLLCCLGHLAKLQPEGNIVGSPIINSLEQPLVQLPSPEAVLCSWTSPFHQPFARSLNHLTSMLLEQHVPALPPGNPFRAQLVSNLTSIRNREPRFRNI